MRVILKNDAIVNGVLYKRGANEINEAIYPQLVTMGLVVEAKVAKEELAKKVKRKRKSKKK